MKWSSFFLSPLSRVYVCIVNDYLEEMAKTIYDYWFVQFEFPDGNGNPYKTSGGALLYNEVLKKEIPFGWTIDTLLLLCEYWNKMDNSQSICRNVLHFLQ